MSEALQHLRAAEDALARLRAVLEDVPLSTPSPEPESPPAATPEPPRGLANPAAFFAAARTSKALGPVLTQGEVEGCEAILAACHGFPPAWAAYCLATAVVETASTMQPIKEIGGPAYFRRLYDIEGDRPAKARELGNLTPGDGARFCGRGFVQITGRANYARASAALGIDLVGNPDLALDPQIAAQIMRRGMQEAWFTGKALATYLPAEADLRQFANARRIINGTDRNVEIAGYALEFQSALIAGGWR